MRRRAFSPVLLALMTLCGAAELGPLASTMSGCTSTPTLPLPPPVVSIGAPAANGLVLVQGTANALAYVHVLNQDTDAGKITRASEQGAFRVELEASVGDTLVIWQERDGDTGERVERTVPVPTP